MPTLSLLGSILVVHWLLTMTPGANAVLVAQTAVASGRVNAIAVIAGICASGAIWVTSASLGLKAVFLAFPWLYTFMSYAGAAYLIWLGVKLLRSKPEPIESQSAGGAPQRLAVSFARGFISNITNPKTLVYFSSVFGTFMPPDAGPATVIAVVLVTWFCNFGWYGGLSFLLSGGTARRMYGRLGTINRIAGGR
ncbi:LysE family translocator [Rhodopila sp.]|uniref:LysE family translocator n=1 Tax=Rhodopila sp. TaxID=2480087 RepID=UPI003D1048F1